MNLLGSFKAYRHTSRASFALLILRLVCGLAFVFHGWGKIQNPFQWMGPDAPMPGFLQMLAAVSEFGGGLAWMVGLLTPLASLGLACTMGVAVYTHAIVKGDPFVGHGGGSYELAAVYLSVALLLFMAGPGNVSLDKKFFGDR